MTVRKIVILNPKGGSGKTTIATNLAAYYANEGRLSALMDYDSQGSSTRWLNKRPDSAATIHGIADGKDNIGLTRSFAMRVPPEIERVIVDTPAALQKHELVNFARSADKIVIPVLPSDIDIHAAARTIADLLLIAKISRHENRLMVVANRVRNNTIVFRSLMRFLGTLEIPVATVLRDTQNYIRTAERGLGLHELPPAQVAKDVIQWKPFIKLLERDPRRSVYQPATPDAASSSLFSQTKPNDAAKLPWSEDPLERSI
ncbi:MAG: ParA family protein [Gammaproteobacteria bacterium]|nr:ParA family protein [Gammaproteobacteria bacterium]